MRTTPISDGAEGIRQIVREWMALLAEDRYEDALDLLYQAPDKRPGTLPHGYGPHWTADELRTVVMYYGCYDDVLDADELPYRVVPVTDSLRESFEAWLRVDWIDGDGSWGLDPAHYAGIVHVELPLGANNDSAHASDHISDVTARFLIRRIGGEALALEFDDARVM